VKCRETPHLARESELNFQRSDKDHIVIVNVNRVLIHRRLAIHRIKTIGNVSLKQKRQQNKKTFLHGFLKGEQL
jgi:hypothetical protein